MAANKNPKKKSRGWLANRSSADQLSPGGAPGAVSHGSDKTFKALVLDSKEPVLVDFWAEWCGPCKKVGPVVEELARDFAGRARVVKMDVDHNPKTSDRYQIRSIPTLMVFREGEVVETLVGAQGKRELGEALARAVG